MRMPGLLLAVFVFGVASLCDGLKCDNGWFGSKCQYKCHCTENRCDDDGECTGDAQCEKGWFGPACQYVDLTVTHGKHPTPKWLLDGDDSTCNPDPKLENVVVVLNDNFLFAWLRVRVKDPAILLQDSVMTNRQMLVANFGYIFPREVARVDATTLDVYYDVPGYFSAVRLGDPIVKALCSVYISGGRNVALRQETSQSSIRNSLSAARHLVDGDVNGKYTQGSCSATSSNGSDQNPSWMVTFSQPCLIYRFEFFDIKDNEVSEYTDETTDYTDYDERDNQKRALRQLNYQPYLKMFMFDEEGASLYHSTMYHGRSSINNLRMVRTENQDLGISRITIQMGDQIPLSFCEIEMYGDSRCEEGRYGRECEHTCNCVGNRTCFVSTGGCPSGCADGYTGESCQLVSFCAGAETAKIGDRCVRLVNERFTWRDAKAACEALGPRVSLAELTSNAVREYVQSMTVAIGSRAWLGATDAAVEGQWVWSSTGNDLDIDPSWWGQGQPDNSYGNENCLIMRPDRFLNDYNCNVGLPYFCQSFK